MREVLGALACGTHVVRLEENLALVEHTDSHELGFRVDGVTVELDLAAIRRLRQLLNDGEKRLMLRAEQVSRRANLSLDLD